jgi:hypothetical protein
MANNKNITENQFRDPFGNIFDKNTEIDSSTTDNSNDSTKEESHYDRKGGLTGKFGFLDIMRHVLFSNGFIMRNRPTNNGILTSAQKLASGVVTVASGIEMFFKKKASQGINSFVIGMTGKGTHRYMNYLNISVDHIKDIGADEGLVNGVFRVRTSTDQADETPDYGGLYIMDRANIKQASHGDTMVFIATDKGNIQLSWAPNKQAAGPGLGTATYDLIIGESGFVFYGLPVVAPPARADGGKTLWNSGGTLRVS